MAAIDAFQKYGTVDASQSDFEQRLALLGAMYTGTWVADIRWPWQGVSDLVYQNSRQVVKHTGSIVDVYEHLVYFGELPAPSAVMRDGDVSNSAIPIIPETNDKARDRELLIAFYTLFQMWQWQMWMSLIPKTAAIFGDVFVELEDDPQHGTVTPEIVYPGYIPTVDLELDAAGNVKRYAKEYTVTIAASTAFGRDVKAETYRYRKEVDGEVYRWFKDGKPAAFPEQGVPKAEMRNPYGFVPACLFRHELVVGGKRGMGAYEKTLAQAIEINSTLSSATDYQRRQFGMPIGVIGSALRAGTSVTMPGGITIGTGATTAEMRKAQRQAAETQNFLPLTDGGQFITAQFSVGDTMAMVEFTHDKMIAENPEAHYGIELLEKSQLTGPGGARMLSPIRAKAQSAMTNHDPQMLKLAQMGTSMLGFRVNNGDIPADIVRARPDRYKALEPYDLTSYGAGLEDATIKIRDPFPESRTEKAQWIILVDGMSDWGKREMGVPEEDIAKDAAERQRQADNEAALLTGIAVSRPQDQGVTGPSGLSGPTGAVA